MTVYDTLIDWISPVETLRTHNQMIKTQFVQFYSSCKYHSSRRDIPSVKQTHNFALSRRDDVLITRLLCRMLIILEIWDRFHIYDN